MKQLITLKNQRKFIYVRILEHNDPLPLCAEEIDMSITAMCGRIRSTVFPKYKPFTKFENLDITGLSFAA